MGFGSWIKERFGGRQKTLTKNLPSEVNEELTVVKKELTKSEQKVNQELISTYEIGKDVREIKVGTTAIINWLQNEGVSRGWFNANFKDTSPEIVKKLNVILTLLTKKGEKKVNVELTNVIVKTLSPNQQLIYEKVCKGKTISLSELVASTKFSKPYLCKVLKQLVNKGLIKKVKAGLYQLVK